MGDHGAQIGRWGTRANLTYDREPGAGTEVLFVGARRHSPASKPQQRPEPLPTPGSQPGAPSSGTGWLERSSGKKVQRSGSSPRTTPSSIPIGSRAAGPPTLTQYRQLAASPESQGTGSRAQPGGSPQKLDPSDQLPPPSPPAAAAHLAPAAACLARSTGSLGSRPPSPAQKPVPQSHPVPGGGPGSPSTDSRVPAPKY